MSTELTEGRVYRLAGHHYRFTRDAEVDELLGIAGTLTPVDPDGDHPLPELTHWGRLGIRDSHGRLAHEAGELVDTGRSYEHD